MIRVIAFFVTITIATPADAFPCWIIRKAVKQYGEAAVEQFARSKGVSEKQIAEHRKCLK